MRIKNIPFGVTDWSQVEPREHKGEIGMAYWRTRQFDEIRVRMVEYSYQVADDAEPHRSYTVIYCRLRKNNDQILDLSHHQQES